MMGVIASKRTYSAWVAVTKKISKSSSVTNCNIADSIRILIIGASLEGRMKYFDVAQ